MKNVCETNDFTKGKNPAIYYTAVCGCGDHYKNIELEYIEDVNDIQANLYYDLHSKDYYWSDNIFQRIWHRIKLALRILIKGSVKVHGDFLFSSSEQIDDYIKALQEGRNKINEAIEKRL